MDDKPASQFPEDGMISFACQIPVTTFKRLRQACLVRAISAPGGGLIEAFVARLVTSIEEGKTEHTFALKRDPE